MILSLLVTGCGKKENIDDNKMSTTGITTKSIEKNQDDKVDNSTIVQDAENSAIEKPPTKSTIETSKSNKTTITKKTTTEKATTTSVKKVNRNIIVCWEVENYKDNTDFAGFIIGTLNVKSKFPKFFNSDRAYVYDEKNLYYSGGNITNGEFYNYTIISSSSDKIKIKVVGASDRNRETGEVHCDHSLYVYEYSYEWKDDNTLYDTNKKLTLNRVSCSKFLPDSNPSLEC